MTALQVLDPKMTAMRAYLVARHQGQDLQTSFDRAVDASDRPWQEVKQWATEARWELAYRALATTSLLETDDSLQSDVEIKRLLKQRYEIEALLETVQGRAEARLPEITVDNLDYVVQLSRDSDHARDQYLKYREALARVDDQILAAKERPAYNFAQHNALPNWAQRKSDITAQLKQAYKGRGPQYDYLCEELAEAKVAVEQVRSHPTGIDPDKLLKFQDRVTSVTNQLQKYTEAQKSEIRREEVQVAVEATLQVVEVHIAATYPILWREIVEDVVRRLGGEVIEHEDGTLMIEAGAED